MSSRRDRTDQQRNWNPITRGRKTIEQSTLHSVMDSAFEEAVASKNLQVFRASHKIAAAELVEKMAQPTDSRVQVEIMPETA